MPTKKKVIKKVKAPKKKPAAPKAKVKKPVVKTWVPNWLIDPRTTCLPPSTGPGMVVRLKKPKSSPPGGGRWVQAAPPLWLASSIVDKAVRAAL